jgi:branched-chain amino acid transport system permease protein
VFGHQVQSPTEWCYVAVVLVILALALAWRLLGSRIGRAWRAISYDAAAAASCGIDAAAYRRLAFVLGSGLAGVAGALFTGVVGYVDPERVDVQISVLLLAMIVIGGAGGVWGALIGALVVGGIDQVGIPVLGAWMARTADTYHLPWLAALDIRGLNFLSFGLVLYLAVLARGRARRQAASLNP